MNYKIVHILLLRKILPTLFLTCQVVAFSQENLVETKISKIEGLSVKKISNKNFREYFEVFADQPLDHSAPGGKHFQQRIFIGVNNPQASVILETGGYAIDYAEQPEYTSELSKELGSNLVSVEHRFFGKSVPDTLNWKFLTVEQASADYHRIKTLLASILTGKWISTGISKGGQAALSYKICFPKDVSASIVYGTGIKTSQEDQRIDQFLTSLAMTPCGKKLSALQRQIFERKKSLLPVFEEYIKSKSYDLGARDMETVFEYLSLELPFSFWQNGNECDKIPDSTSGNNEVVNYLCSVVSPKFFSATMKLKLEPAFYMFYHELGYYEYDITQFRQWLHQTYYSNKDFAPSVDFLFDNTYLKKVNSFLETPGAESVIFIYGELDPWSSMQQTKNAKKFVVRSGNHKSRISNMTEEQKAKLYTYLNYLLK